MTIHDVCDLILLRQGSISLVRIQTLLYYTQAWHLALRGRPLFPGRFQAWVHGPISREIFDRFRDRTRLGSAGPEDIREGFDPTRFPQDQTGFVDTVLETYTGLDGIQLSEMARREPPWLTARTGYGPPERCEVEIDEALMGSYYQKDHP